MRRIWRRPALCGALTFGFGLAAWMQLALAQDTLGQDTLGQDKLGQDKLEFDIPAQSLPAALEAYGDVTGRNVIFNSNLTADRRSTAVRGALAPDAALSTLLEGTGLAVRYATPESFVLLPAPAGPAVIPQGVVAAYYGRVQLSLRNALCSDDDARPGGYRIAIRLWVDPAGSVTAYQRLNSTGTSRIDAGIDRSMRALRIGLPPPATLEQPISIAIQPQAPGVTMGCETSATGRAGATP